MPELYPFQETGALFLRSRKRAILADEMGLGKTNMALAAAELPVLVVCPESIRTQWCEEAKRWQGWTAEVMTGKYTPDGSCQLVVCGYTILAKRYPDLVGQFATVILDEAHYCKNYRAKRSKAAARVSQYAQNVFLLTGTPITNRPVEFFQLLRVCRHELGRQFLPYARQYCGAYYTRFGLDSSGASNLPELRQKISSVYLRRTRNDVMPDLPPLLRGWYAIDANAECLNREARKAATLVLTGGSKYTEGVARLNQLRLEAEMARLPSVEEMLREADSQDQPVIVYSSFLKPLDYLHSQFQQASHIDGRVTDSRRDKQIERFQRRGTNILLATMRTGGVGLNLQCANEVWFMDLDWTPATHSQAEGRVWRIGQKRKVTARYFYTPSFVIDQEMRDRLGDKLDIIEQLFGKESGGRITENMDMTRDIMSSLVRGEDF